MRIPGRAGFWLERLRISVQNRGLLGTIKKTAAFGRFFITPAGRRERKFDKQSGVDTSGRIGQYELGVHTASVACAGEYRPTPVDAFLRILAGLEIDYPEWTFVDLGSGKGRALLLASQFPFQEIVGVEFSAQLVGVAQENLAQYRGSHRRCENMSVICGDATEYRLPPGKLVLYLNNPFRGAVMEQVVANIERSLHESPRQICIIYWNPFCEGMFQGAASLCQAGEGEHYRIYRTAAGLLEKQ